MAGSTAFSERQPRRVRAAIITATLALAVAIPATAFAGKGGGGSSTQPWIALASVDGAPLATAQPRVGSSVRFSTGYPSATKNPWVSVTCWYGGTMFYGEGGSPSHEFVLGGESSGAGGTASCRAELGDLYWRGGKQYYTYLAHTNFEAAT
jgi:hypothetical protein